jgi:GT2 family glycosyltransferase
MIDLCVVNYNTRPLLQRLLDNLHVGLNENNKFWNLYIADNDSSDDTVDWLNDNNHRYKIDGIDLNKNIGYSAASNRLATKGTNDIIGILNADVWFTNKDIEKIYQIFNQEPSIHILGPKQRDEYGNIKHGGITGTGKNPIMRGWNESDPKDILYRDRINCVTISGSAYFIRRNVWDALTNNKQYQEIFPGAIGAFLPTPHYYEETWCSYFARHLGYNVVYDGSVSIGHSWHASSPKPGEGYSHVDAQFKLSQSIFRKACDYIGIERD